MKKGILLCCHGTRDHHGINDTVKLLRFFKKKKPNYKVKIGYLEILKPTIKDQLDFFFSSKFDYLLIVPAMIFSGNHVTKDIPKIVKNFKKRYKNIPKIKFIPPLSKAKNFFNMIQNKLSFHQSSVSLEIIGLPDYSNNENKAPLTGPPPS